MSMPTEDSLTKLNEEIRTLKNEISDCKADLSIQEIRNNAYVTALNVRLAGLETDKRNLIAQASPTTTAQQGNKSFLLKSSIACTGNFSNFYCI